MTQRRSSLIRSIRLSAIWLPLALAYRPAAAQQINVASVHADNNLAESVQDLREQVRELRTAVADIKSEAAQYRAESAELRHELENLRAAPGLPVAGKQEDTKSAMAPVASSTQADKRLASIEETSQVLESQVRTQDQTKVESTSKYRVRLSGLVLLNLFSNRGAVDNLDFPTYAAPTNVYGANSTFGATLRQSELGLEVFGPQWGGAKTSGQLQFDFGGGFPSAALDGINTGLVRLRTASMRLDWGRTSIIGGQDGLFISPLSPTSFASLVIPSLGYSGNLWAWTPQVRVEHRFDLRDDQNMTIQAGFMDNVTGEPSYGSHRQPQAGESSSQPAYAVRTGWNKTLGGRALSLGASGYYSRQNWGYGWEVDGWAAMTDWRIPVTSRVEISGEFYRGRGVGGLGGGIGQSIIFSGSPQDPASDFRPIDSAGGWSQVKFWANSRLEFNVAFGVDSPFAEDIHAFASPIGYYPTVLASNRSSLFNFVYRPRADLLFSGEYRHLHTTEIGAYNTAGQINMTMGVLF